MGHIFAYMTCTRVRWADDDEGNPIEEPIDEHGWIDRSWSPYVLYDSRDDVRPLVDVSEDDTEALKDEIEDALGKLDGGYEDNGDGTFYACESYSPPYDNPEGWDYSYALHFKREFCGPKGWTEKAWHPKTDGGIEV